jgi:hypothetical protein
MMLKKGQVYKLTYKNIDGIYQRNYMILSPAEDILIRSSKIRKTICPIFHINLGGFFNHYAYMGIEGVIKIEKPNTVQDFEDIERAMKRYGFTYNRKLNRVEGYDIREK